jgi:CHAT domain-containing protein
LSAYAISSYCSSPKDLIDTEAPSPSSSPFKTFAVIEPNSVDGSAALPYTLTELDNIKSHLPDEHQLIPYNYSVGLQTSLRTVLDNIRRASCVHFGCHGRQDLKNPLKSSLLLSGGELSMSTIIQECQSSGASLAYLSACETAKGDDRRPDESLNLVATMFFAGFQSVVGTMWCV